MTRSSNSSSLREKKMNNGALMGSKDWHPTVTKPFHFAIDERHQPGHEHAAFVAAHSSTARNDAAAKTRMNNQHRHPQQPSMGSKEWHPTDTLPFHFATDERHEPGHAHAAHMAALSPPAKEAASAKKMINPPAMGSADWQPTETMAFHFRTDERHEPGHEHAGFLAAHAATMEEENSHPPSPAGHRHPSMGSKEWHPTKTEEFHFHEPFKHKPEEDTGPPRPPSVHHGNSKISLSLICQRPAVIEGRRVTV